MSCLLPRSVRGRSRPRQGRLYNYLGLTTHPKLRQAALDALRDFGVGSGAVRTISGTMAMRVELERRLAVFKNVEAVVVFRAGSPPMSRALCHGSKKP